MSVRDKRNCAGRSVLTFIHSRISLLSWSVQWSQECAAVMERSKNMDVILIGFMVLYW
jgi:hypothetical protein